MADSTIIYGKPLLQDQDLHYFNEGTHYNLFDKLGSHPGEVDGIKGTHFAVWAPNAAKVSVVGDFNDWQAGRHELRPFGSSGIWEGFLPGVGKGNLYKYAIQSRHNDYSVQKTDPFAMHTELPPKTASVVWELDYAWEDQSWMDIRAKRNALDAPISIYEMHLGSWKRKPGSHDSFSYRELGPELVPYLKDLGFTHVELMPVTEHPYYGSWGYQVTGYFAPTSRYGTPQDFKYFVDYLHQEGIGVLIDWVPSHFATDEFALSYFDGTHLFEHADSRQGFHPDWNSYIFNYSRHEIRSFLLSSALYWLKEYHIDGLRVDAVASMLYLDYSRKQGEWVPNEHGGRENLAAIKFLKDFNEAVYKEHPGAMTVAEESTSWPMVSRPTYLGGLGFGLKWDMGWMHDTLEYMKLDPIHRKFHHRNLTFRYLYAHHENFVLSLSHDEVVHMKGSLLNKMAGDEWQKFANLRLLYGSMFGQPGKKLLFMGSEFGQYEEWNHDAQLSWHLLNVNSHAGVKHWLHDLHQVYKFEPALFEQDFDPQGFQWIDADDTERSIISFLRRDRSAKREVIVICNFTPVVRHHYRVGVPTPGAWKEILNSDGYQYGGSNVINPESLEATPHPHNGMTYSLELTLPPLGCVFLRPEGL